MRLAVFDLDFTLIPMCSGEAWVHYLVEKNGMEGSETAARIDRFQSDYDQGRLDVADFMDFQMTFLAQFRRADLDAWRAACFEERLLPFIPEASRELVAGYNRAGHETALCSGTYAYVTQPYAEHFGMHHNFAPNPAVDPVTGEFNGRLADAPNFGEGKVARVKAWVERRAREGRPYEAVDAYSDSASDLPLLRYAAGTGGRAVAANPLPPFAEIARAEGWEIITTFEPEMKAKARACFDVRVSGRS
ncbi:MAG: haloacid dehalogenase-like hydrolase [Duodenibacillus sp.]|nr:haloacid dehalogenase-like hydrolase [Duodenibacillus sp.]